MESLRPRLLVMNDPSVGPPRTAVTCGTWGGCGRIVRCCLTVAVDFLLAALMITAHSCCCWLLLLTNALSAQHRLFPPCDLVIPCGPSLRLPSPPRSSLMLLVRDWQTADRTQDRCVQSFLSSIRWTQRKLSSSSPTLAKNESNHQEIGPAHCLFLLNLCLLFSLPRSLRLPLLTL